MGIKKEKFLNFSKRIGLASLAVLWCLEERGEFILESMTGESRRKSLSRKLDEINNLKTIDEYYEILKNLGKNTAKTIIWRLEKKGLVKKTDNKLILTETGKSFYDDIKNKINKKESWDGKFRIVMFDVPENRKSQREFLRYALRRQEYNQLQKSVFLGKFPLEKDFIESLIEKNIYQYLRMIVVGDIDDESILEKF